MNTKVRFAAWWVAVAAILGAGSTWAQGTSNGGPYIVDANTVLLLHFDEDLNGEQGETSTLADGVSLAPGRFGQGLLADESDRLLFDTLGNVALEEGTIEFWIKPSWPGTDPSGHIFLEIGDCFYCDRMRVMHDGVSIRFMTWDSGGESGLAPWAQNWVEDEWHHVGVTWSGNQIALYVDFELISSGTADHFPMALSSTIEIGSACPYGEPDCNPTALQVADGVIDEFRISNVVREFELPPPPGPSNGGPYDFDANTLLLLHFDGTFEGAQGELPSSEVGTFEQGIFGQGVDATPAEYEWLEYPAYGNIDWPTGTLEFWVSPSWNGNDSAQHTLFSAYGSFRNNHLAIAKDGANNLRYLMWDEFGNEIGVFASVGSWVAGEWHHVGITWSPSEIALYVDFTLRQSLAVATPPMTFQTLNLSHSVGDQTPLWGWGPDAVVDEFRISNVVREFEPPAPPGPSSGGPYAPDADTLLLLHFDGTFEGAQGEFPSSELGSFSQGRFGQGVDATPATYEWLEYSSAHNIDTSEGSLEFWIKPNWNGNDSAQHTLFSAYGVQNQNHLLIPKNSGNMLHFIIWDGSGVGYGLGHSVWDWVAGEWHHLAFTWNATELKMFEDFVLVDVQPAPPIPISVQTLNFSHSVGDQTPLWGWGPNAVIDEFRISRIVHDYAPPPPSGIPALERDALIALYESTGGASWNTRTNWRNVTDTDFNDPGTECTWFGVACDASLEHVTEIRLGDNNLTGGLPSALAALSELRVLDLPWNFNLTGDLYDGATSSWVGALTKLEIFNVYQGGGLQGAVPVEFGTLPALQELTLDFNQFSGEVPAELCDSTSLTRLNLGFNQLSGPVPSCLGNMTQLVALELFSNHFWGTLPDELGNLTAMQGLSLGANPDMDPEPIPEWLAGMTDLRYLDLRNMNLTGLIPAWIGNLNQLQNLYLATNQLEGSIPQEIGYLTNLGELDLDDNQLTGPIPPAIGNLSHAWNVNLAWNELTGEIPPELGNLASAWVLSLEHNHLSGEIPAALSNLTGLGVLLLAWNDLEGPIPAEIGLMVGLRGLDLGANHLTGPIPSEIGNLPYLQGMYLGRNALTGPIPSTLVNLTELVDGGSHFAWNGLYADNPELAALLARTECCVVDWRASQTIAPTGVAVDTVRSRSVDLSWTPITYTADAGGYEVLYSTTPGGPYELSGITADKAASSLTVNGLAPATSYFFVVRAVTYPHAMNTNTVASGYSEEVSATTTPPMLPALEIDDGGIVEGTGGTVTVQLQVHLSEPAPDIVTVEYGYEDDTAIAGSDYLPAAGTVTFNPGEVSATVEVQIVGDSLQEGNETFFIFLVNPVNATIGRSTALVTIIDDDVNIPITERDALIALYNSAGGANWNNRTNWRNTADTDFNDPGTECTWAGIACDANREHVTEVRLGDNGLAGELPSVLGSLSELRALDLSWNFGLTGDLYDGEASSWVGELTKLEVFNVYQGGSLNGAIPVEFAALSALHELTLDFNHFSGEVPTELCDSTSLTSLALGFNELSGPMPPCLGSMSQLVGLELFNNRFTGTIPSEYGDLDGLQFLSLGNNWLMDNEVIPEWLGALTQLRYVDLGGMNLIGEIPVSLGNLSQLEELHLAGNQLTGPIPGALGNLAALRVLDLYSNQLSGSIPPELGQLQQLWVLSLCANNLTGQIPESLGDLHNVGYLNLWGNHLSGPIPATFGGLTLVEELWLYSNELSGPIPPELGQLSHLRGLDLNNNRLTGQIPPELGNLSNLYMLRIAGNVLTGRVPDSLLNLTGLLDGWSNLAWNGLYTDNPAVDALLSRIQCCDWDWKATQTIPPTDVWAAATGPDSVEISWTPILYTGGNGGGYRVFFSTTSGGPYSYFGITADKTISSLTVTGLADDTSYFFVVQSVTAAGWGNQSDVESELSAEVSATTGSGNHPPVLVPVGDQSIAEHELLELWLSATDPDGDPVAYSIQPGTAPPGATLDPMTGYFSYMPEYDVSTVDANAYFDVVFIAQDPSSAWSSCTTRITVLDVNGGTPSGDDVTVNPVDPETGTSPVSLTFDEVIEGGETTVTTTTGGPPPEIGFRLGNNTYVEIDTEASFTPPIRLCFDYSTYGITGNRESRLRLYHRVPQGGFMNDGTECTVPPTGCWDDITDPDDPPDHPNPDTTNDIICGTSNSLSPFAIVEAIEISAPIDPVAVNTQVSASLDLGEGGGVDQAIWEWGDLTSSAATIENGVVTGNHTYVAAGIQTLHITLLNESLEVGSAEFRYVVVYDPEGGFVTGGGWITSPLGAYVPDPTLTGRATFGFVSKYKKGASVPTGTTEFQFHAAGFNFRSTSYQWLVVAGAKAKFKGEGEINGGGSYGFMLSATDGALPGGGGSDKFRIKIWDKATDVVVYDNQLGAPDDADPTTVIGGGSIVIHQN